MKKGVEERFLENNKMVNRRKTDGRAKEKLWPQILKGCQDLFYYLFLCSLQAQDISEILYPENIKYSPYRRSRKLDPIKWARVIYIAEILR